jgi:4a-hydroxytetrahydrobiopterin dehydratase
MATLLDEHLVGDALQGLDGWAGDTGRIVRTATVDDADGVLAELAVVADAMDHHPQVSRDGAALTFTLWTHSAGGVTELDITLASRIDDLVRQHTSGSGQPAYPQSSTRAASGAAQTMQPRYDDASSRPATARDAAAPGEQPWHEGDAGTDDQTLHPAADPRAGAGPVVAPKD